MCNVKYGMNLRYANMWYMLLRLLAFSNTKLNPWPMTPCDSTRCNTLRILTYPISHSRRSRWAVVAMSSAAFVDGHVR